MVPYGVQVDGARDGGQRALSDGDVDLITVSVHEHLVLRGYLEGPEKALHDLPAPAEPELLVDCLHEAVGHVHREAVNLGAQNHVLFLFLILGVQPMRGVLQAHAVRYYDLANVAAVRNLYIPKLLTLVLFLSHKISFCKVGELLLFFLFTFFGCAWRSYFLSLKIALPQVIRDSSSSLDGTNIITSKPAFFSASSASSYG